MKLRCFDVIDVIMIVLAFVFLGMIYFGTTIQSNQPDHTVNELKRMNKNIEIYLIQNDMWPAGEPLPEWMEK
jgi:biopolymer transport protein ExbD